MKAKLLLVGLLIAAPCQAGISNLTPNTFISSHVVSVRGSSPERTYRRFMQIRRWWNPEHTYTGKLSKLTLDREAGGCLCEDLPKGGSIEHMRVSLVQPGERLVLT